MPSDKLAMVNVAKLLADTMDTIHRRAKAAQDKLYQEYQGYQSALPDGVDSDLLWTKYQLEYITIEQEYNTRITTALDEYRVGLEPLIADLIRKSN